VGWGREGLKLSRLKILAAIPSLAVTWRDFSTKVLNLSGGM
jgi:hypothetical protein